ncbi:MAG: DUF5718 family protein, partial [Methyloprofundus sp.]|nr:DUF5718 family protein [Methyloprofundus sp.]
TEFGETAFLKPEDEIGVFIYHARKANKTDIEQFFTEQRPVDAFISGAVLMQTVRKYSETPCQKIEIIVKIHRNLLKGRFKSIKLTNFLGGV